MSMIKIFRYFKASVCYFIITLSGRWGGVKYMSHWYNVLPVDFHNEFRNFCYYFIHLKEYRSVLYWRIGGFCGEFLKLVASPHPTLYIDIAPDKVSDGLVIQHGHSTIIYAESIGKNCQIWQNVTIGKKVSGGKKPIIGDNVKIYAGAIVMGNITIGNNVQIGANSVVNKSVPSDCVVAGNPARIIVRNGIRVNEKL